jgi:trimeric autotransporter adhesin
MFNQNLIKMSKKITTFILSFLCLVGVATVDGQTTVSGNITGNVTWTKTNTYTLDGFVFVEDGASITIEAGTVIKAETGSGENATALIIKRGGKIIANGTEDEPIIFTSVNDDDLTLSSDFKGLWGGLIILGNGPHNNPDNNNNIEGVPETENAFYGGNDPDDNSGVLKFVSIRHGGSELGPDEEINGLTLGAVGAGTEIHHVEVMGNDDDGIEWFGGNVDAKYLVVSDVADDSYDIDEGFTGKGQFWFTKQSGDGTGDNLGEHDGGPSNNLWGTPFTTPVISNATYVGGGDGPGDRLLTLRQFFGGKYYNSIFAEQDKGIRVEYVPEFDDEGELGGAFTQWNAWGNLKIENNIFQNVADSATFESIISVYSPEDDVTEEPIYEVPQDSIDAFVEYIEQNNTIANAGVSDAAPVPTEDVSGAAFGSLDSWFTRVTFRGAFNPDVTGHWAGGWTYTFSSDDYNDDIGQVESGTTIIISDDISGDSTWTSNNTYVLDGFIFVKDGASLTIEAGTVVKAFTGSGENATALIIKRGGKIFANGTKDEPIIFTSVNDDDLTLSSDFKGLWGGLIILGNGPHNNPDNNNNIEGVPETENAFYGGNDPDDNSGVLKFVSIRHGGSELGPNEEINGLTLGAIGAGTEIHHVEVFANDDDGVEWFGGNVNTKYMVVTDVSDDSYDIDEGFSGYGQFWFTKQSGDGTGDNLGEHDGGPSNNRWGKPFTTPVVSNATYVGGGASAGDRSLTLREFFGGSYYNSVFANQAKGIRVEYVPEFDEGELGGAFTQWNAWDNMHIENNIFQNVADGTFGGIISVYSPEDDNDQPIYDVPQDSIDAFVAYMESMNTVADVGVTASAPIPTGDVSGAMFSSLPEWFDSTNYKGAFNPMISGHWAGGWTKTFAGDTYNDEVLTGIFDTPYSVITANIYPNPVVISARVSFENPNNEAFTFNVYGMDGRLVRRIENIRNNSFDFTKDNLNTGIYIYELRSATSVSTGKVLVK